MSGLSIRIARLALVAGALSAAPFFAPAGAVEPAPGEAAFTTAQVSDAALSESRGAFVPSTINFNNVSLIGQDTGNVVIGGVTGMNNIASNGISGTSGLVNVIQNSGNNVLIQSSTIVNVTLNNH